ncbi:MAG: MBL fold metallo-hydrolase [Phycisphaerae bacterium]
MQITGFIEPSFGENAYVVWQRDGGPCWIIDPGPPPSADKVLRHVNDRALAPDALLLTHGHADHIAGVPEILAQFPELPVYIADAERAALTDPEHNLSAALGTPFRTNVTDTRDLPDNATLTLDGAVWQVLDTSGHSPGGRSLYCADATLVIVGDALFQQSIGRTDFPHSDHQRLIRNIKTRLLTLPDATRVYSGHGAITTIGEEKRLNPFLH